MATCLLGYEGKDQVISIQETLATQNSNCGSSREMSWLVGTREEVEGRKALTDSVEVSARESINRGLKVVEM